MGHVCAVGSLGLEKGPGPLATRWVLRASGSVSSDRKGDWPRSCEGRSDRTWTPAWLPEGRGGGDEEGAGEGSNTGRQEGPRPRVPSTKWGVLHSFTYTRNLYSVTAVNTNTFKKKKELSLSPLLAAALPPPLAPGPRGNSDHRLHRCRGLPALGLGTGSPRAPSCRERCPRLPLPHGPARPGPAVQLRRAVCQHHLGPRRCSGPSPVSPPPARRSGLNGSQLSAPTQPVGRSSSSSSGIRLQRSQATCRLLHGGHPLPHPAFILAAAQPQPYTAPGSFAFPFKDFIYF